MPTYLIWLLLVHAFRLLIIPKRLFLDSGAEYIPQNSIFVFRTTTSFPYTTHIWESKNGEKFSSPHLYQVHTSEWGSKIAHVFNGHFRCCKVQHYLEHTLGLHTCMHARLVTSHSSQHVPCAHDMLRTIWKSNSGRCCLCKPQTI